MLSQILFALQKTQQERQSNVPKSIKSTTFNTVIWKRSLHLGFNPQLTQRQAYPSSGSQFGSVVAVAELPKEDGSGSDVRAAVQGGRKAVQN